MRSKNLMIGILAFIFAIGTAFVTPKLAPTSIWVKAQLTQTDIFRCWETTSKCDNSGGWVCNVWINTSTGLKLTSGRDAGSCALLWHTSPVEQTVFLRTGVTPYDVQ